MKKSFEAIPVSEVSTFIDSSPTLKRHGDFILAEMSGTYPFVTLSYSKDGEWEELVIEEFHYDDWIHSETGEHGRSQHGTYRKFKWTSGKWGGREIVHYGG